MGTRTKTLIAGQGFHFTKLFFAFKIVSSTYSPRGNGPVTRWRNRSGKDRENQGCRNRRHATEGVVLRVDILAACGSPPAPKIDLSNCSAGTANIAFPVDDRSQFDPYGTLSWPPVTGATAYVLAAGTQANSTDVWSGTILEPRRRRCRACNPSLPITFSWRRKPARHVRWTSASATSGAGLSHLKTPAEGGTEIDPEVELLLERRGRCRDVQAANFECGRGWQ